MSDLRPRRIPRTSKKLAGELEKAVQPFWLDANLREAALGRAGKARRPCNVYQEESIPSRRPWANTLSRSI